MDLCGWFYKLKNIDKLYPRTDGIWTHYGTLFHKCVQNVLMDIWTPEYGAKYFIRAWFRFCRMYKKQLAQNMADDEFKLPKKCKAPKDIYRNPVRAIMEIKDAFKKEFGPHKVLWVEERLEEPTEYPQVFTGLIDIGILLVDGTIIIADFKTCSSHFMFKKYLTKFKEYQITLYKSHYCKKHNVDPKTVETYFITMAKDPAVKKPLNFMRVTSGPVKMTNANNWLNKGLEKIQTNNFQKKRTSCHKFFGKDCPFYDSPECPTQNLI